MYLLSEDIGGISYILSTIFNSILSIYQLLIIYIDINFITDIFFDIALSFSLLLRVMNLCIFHMLYAADEPDTDAN